MDWKKLARDELIGLAVKIKKSTDPSWEGVSGRVIDETKNTFTIKTDEQVKQIAKKNVIFEFEKNGKRIMIDGSKIMYRPEDRIKKIR